MTNYWQTTNIIITIIICAYSINGILNLMRCANVFHVSCVYLYSIACYNPISSSDSATVQYNILQHLSNLLKSLKLPIKWKQARARIFNFEVEACRILVSVYKRLCLRLWPLLAAIGYSWRSRQMYKSTRIKLGHCRSLSFVYMIDWLIDGMMHWCHIAGTTARHGTRRLGGGVAGRVAMDVA